jgi:3',5'-cyclic AMP phosphodiesterase CpdA
MLAGRCYYVDYQGVRMISLDVNVLAAKPSTEARRKATEQQLAWLEKVLEDNPNHWTVVFQHQPVYPVAKGRTAERLQELLVPVFDKYNVDLVLAGHDHVYGRTFKLRGGKTVAESKPGTYYTVSVSGPKMYEISPATPLMAKTLVKSQLYQVVGVSADRLTYDAYTIDGNCFDRFEIRKRTRR